MNMEVKLTRVVPRFATAALLITTALKLWHVATTPLTGNTQPVPVLGVLTQREALLAAASFEILVAYTIIQSLHAWQAGACLLYFASGMPLCRIGLPLTRIPRCGGLGTATNLVGNKLATLISRGLLVARWLVGLFLVWPRTHIATDGQSPSCPKDGRPLQILLLAWLLSLDAYYSRAGTTIHARGHFSYTHERRGAPSTETTEFDVLFDNDGLKLTKTQPAFPSRRYGMQGRCTSILYVTKDVLLTVIRCGDTVTARFDRAAYAWDLGNCGATLETCAFLTLRCESLFPKLSDRRRVAPPWTTIGQTLGLLFEARYDWLHSGQTEQELVGNMVVSEALKRGWLKSEFRTPTLIYPDIMSDEKNSISAYAPGFIGGTMHFTHFTNIAGIRFPTRSEFKAFSPSGTNNAARKSSGPREVTYRLAFDLIQATSEPVKMLPIEAADVQVTDLRLFDHTLGVAYGWYQTNSLHTFEISPAARQEFESRREKARGKLRLERLRKLLLAGLSVTILLGPMSIVVLRRRRNVQGAKA